MYRDLLHGDKTYGDVAYGNIFSCTHLVTFQRDGILLLLSNFVKFFATTPALTLCEIQKIFSDLRIKGKMSPLWRLVSNTQQPWPLLCTCTVYSPQL
jgi:hypothetical protein